ncbi:MAG: cation:proton antiporter [Acidobacteriota bacterium]|nr:cation:proton antiporter [Acidobacteriota bacterium]
MNIFFAASIGPTTEILLALFLMLLAAKLAAEVFERLHQPAVVGEILAGVIIGPSVLGLVAPSEFITMLAEIGVIFLLFSVGLETKPSSIFQVGKTAVLVAVLGVVLPFFGGWLLMRLWGATTISSLFVGTALVATSVGITARVLASLQLLNTPVARIILGAAVIDDILGLLVLSVVSSSSAGTINYWEIGTTSVLAIGFTAFVALIGARAVTRVAPRIHNLQISESLFVAGLVLCLGLAVAVSFIGVAAIIGAFLAGMALAEATEGDERLHVQTNGVMEFLVPFFLVNIGMQLQLAVFRDWSLVWLALAVTLVALATKLIGCGAGAWSLGLKRATQVGVGMMPRGEVGIVVAQIGLSLAVIDAQLYAVVLFMAVATTLVAPPLLTVLFKTEKTIHERTRNNSN